MRMLLLWAGATACGRSGRQRTVRRARRFRAQKQQRPPGLMRERPFVDVDA